MADHEAIQPEIVARFQWTFADHWDGHRCHKDHRLPRLSRIAWQAALGLLVSIGLVVFAKLQHDRWMHYETLSVFGLWLLLVLILNSSLPARDEYSKSPNNDKEAEWRFGNNAVTFSAAGSTHEIKWAVYSKGVRGSKGLLLYLGDRAYQWIPRRAFTSQSDFDRASELARSKIELFYDAA